MSGLAIVLLLTFSLVAMGFLTSPSCNCCATCTYFSDDFNRATGTSLGSDWSEDAGDWSLAGGGFSPTYLTVGSTSAAVSCTTDADSSDHAVVVDVSADTTGDKMRACVRYVDKDNYLAVEVEWGSGSGTEDTVLRLVSRSSGSDTVLEEAAPFGANLNTSYELRCCVVGTRLSGMFVYTDFGASYEVWAEATVSTSTENTVALATGDTLSGTPQWDNFAIQNPSASSCVGCGDCNHCSGTVPMEISVTFSGIANYTGCTTCDDLNDTFVLDFLWERQGSPLYCQWSYLIPSDSCGYERITATLQVSGGNYSLSVAIADDDSALSLLWSSVLGSSAPDCDAWSSESLDAQESTLDLCDHGWDSGSPATCEVTAA